MEERYVIRHCKECKIKDNQTGCSCESIQVNTNYYPTQESTEEKKEYIFPQSDGVIKCPKCYSELAVDKVSQEPMEWEERRKTIHLKCLAKSKNAKECGDLTVIPMGYVVSIIIDEIKQAEERERERIVKETKRIINEYRAERYNVDILEALHEVENRLLNHLNQSKQ